jgi:hypothetical protein
MHPSYFPVFFWSLLIFVSFWGYGEILRRRIDRPEFADLGWGLTCAWGMSVVLAAVVLFGAAAELSFIGSEMRSLTRSRTMGCASCEQGFLAIAMVLIVV